MQVYWHRDPHFHKKYFKGLQIPVSHLNGQTVVCGLQTCCLPDREQHNWLCLETKQGNPLLLDQPRSRGLGCGSLKHSWDWQEQKSIQFPRSEEQSLGSSLQPSLVILPQHCNSQSSRALYAGDNLPLLLSCLESENLLILALSCLLLVLQCLSLLSCTLHRLTAPR